MDRHGWLQLMRVDPGSADPWWTHLRRRADEQPRTPAHDPATSRGLWPVITRSAEGGRPPTVLDALGPEPPVLGQLVLADDGLNLRAEVLGVTERSLGWLRTWGRHFPELPEELLDFVVEQVQHPERARFSSVEAAQDVIGALAPVLLECTQLLLAGRVDEAWLERTRSLVALFDSMGLGLDVITCTLPVRMLALRDFALDAGATAEEVATLLVAATAYDQFFVSVCGDAFATAHHHRPVSAAVDAVVTADAAPPMIDLSGSAADELTRSQR